MSMLRRGQGHGQARATSTETHTHTHTHTYIYTCGRSHGPSLLVAECQSWGPRKGHYFRYMEAYKHRRKIYTYKHTHAGMTLSVTSSSVDCGSATCTPLTRSSFDFISLHFSANWNVFFFFKCHAVNLKLENL